MIIKSYKEYNQVNEGLKDWVVGALMGLSSLSTIQAQNIKNSDIINQINTTISNTQSIETIADSLSKKEGISKEEAINIINKNAQDVTNKLKDSKSRTTTSTTNYKTRRLHVLQKLAPSNSVSCMSQLTCPHGFSKVSPFI
jgi:hypothetical protein